MPESGKKKAKQQQANNKQQQQGSTVQSSAGGKKGENGKKSSAKGGSAGSRTPEMESLIHWTEQAVKGIPTVIQNVDIPTLVECLVMIDGPFEVICDLIKKSLILVVAKTRRIAIHDALRYLGVLNCELCLFSR